jgi:hypothetical protein
MTYSRLGKKSTQNPKSRRSGTSIAEMLTQNIAEALGTYNLVTLSQIYLAARLSLIEIKLPELIANYRNAHRR